MSALLDQVRRALMPDYLVDGELASGGMGTVFLARDVQLDRPVAVKVLQPEKATAVASKRFIREARILARLRHPNIVPVHRAGESGGLQYYVMDFLGGETLAGRLTLGPIPPQEAIALGRDLLDALAEAHRHGVIHRDVKPANIFLVDGHAVLADFGVAHSPAGGDETLTEPGRVLGTVAYMAPEQLTSGEITTRTDLHAAGQVLYEATTGRRWSLTTEPDQVDWSELPSELLIALRGALAWRPEHRWKDAASFRAVLTVGGADTPTGFTAPRASSPRTWLLPWGIPSLGIALSFVLAVFWSLRRGEASPAGDRIAVFPFTVAGADSTLVYLHEGIADLLVAKLSAFDGRPVTDAGRAIREWRQRGGSERAQPEAKSLRSAAARLGASTFVFGAVVGSPHHLVITIEAHTVDGRRPRHASVDGPADSLDALVDRLATLALGLQADERIESLSRTSAPMPALQSYLRGLTAYRKGALAEAADHFLAALYADSTFALAGLRFVMATSQSGHAQMGRGMRWAWASREQLAASDRSFLEALLRPALPNRATYDEVLEAWDTAVNAAPERAEGWFALGDWLFRFGPLTTRASPWLLARKALERAVTLDPAHGPALMRLVEVAGSLNDTAAVRLYGQRFLQLDSAGVAGDYVAWRMAVARGDSAWRRRFMARFPNAAEGAPEGHANSLTQLIWTAQLDGVALEDADSAARVLLGAAVTASGAQQHRITAHDLFQNRGQPGLAERLLDEGARGSPSAGGSQVYRLLDALYWDGDSIAARNAAASIPLATFQHAMTYEAGRLGCLLEQWHLAHGDTSTTRQVIAWLRRSAAPVDSFAINAGKTCAIVLEAIHAVQSAAPDADQRLSTLDSLVTRGHPSGVTSVAENLVIARLATERGRYAMGLAATRRHWHWGRVMYLSTYLREEARLATLVGDTTGAVRAWRHYLSLRSSPEPTLQLDEGRARAELARLEAHY